MRIDYRVGLNDFHSEWVCPEHARGSYARQKFEAWWRTRSNEPSPESAQDAVDLADRGALAETKTITVRSVAGERFDRIINYQLGPIPPRLDGSDERDDGSATHDPLMDIPDDEIPF